MLANRTKLLATMSLGILLWVFGCVSFSETAQNGSEGQAPIRGLTITIDASRREELFSQLREFADKHRFEFSLTFYDKDKNFFLVAMYRHDLKILAADVPKAPTMIRLDFYERDPATPTPQETVDALFSDIKSFINKIPNVTITE